MDSDVSHLYQLNLRPTEQTQWLTPPQKKSNNEDRDCRLNGERGGKRSLTFLRQRPVPSGATLTFIFPSQSLIKHWLHAKSLQSNEEMWTWDQCDSPTWAGAVGLVLIPATVVCSITKPSFGNAAIVAAFKITSGTRVIICEVQKRIKREPTALLGLQQ